MSILESSIQVLNSNLFDVGSVISSTKSKFVHFSKRTLLGDTIIRTRGFEIESCDQFRFLGVNFDSRFTLDAHVQQVHCRCMSFMKIVKFLCGMWWVLHLDTLIILYKSFIRSLIDYGCFIYFSKSVKIRTKIEKI